MKICFVVPSVFDMRGDVRATVNLATALAARHEVEILSVRRTRERPFFPVPSTTGNCQSRSASTRSLASSVCSSPLLP